MPKPNKHSSRLLCKNYSRANEPRFTDSLFTKNERDFQKLPNLTNAYAQQNTKNKAKRSISESIENRNGTFNLLNRKKNSKSKSSQNLINAKTRVFISNKNTIKIYDSVPTESMPPLHITNQDEVKKLFFESKIPPYLKFKAENEIVQNILTKHNQPSYTHFFKAKHILDVVKLQYPLGLQQYFEANFGKKISSRECVAAISRYLAESKIFGDISVNFAPGLTCSARITSNNILKGKPEARKFVIWINDGNENQFLRQKGIIALCDHEIGTHYYRAFNDGLQIWFTDRKKFELRSSNSSELLKTEEGIAALHTLMNANLKYLLLPALLYYLACMADKMTFEQLYNHMELYIESPEERWKLITRVKRGISDPHVTGCYARDQSYFEGAIEILENIEKTDFILLMSGKICLDELDRVKKISRLDNIRLPKFFENLDKYKEELRNIGILNGIIDNQKKLPIQLSKSNTKQSDLFEDELEFKDELDENNKDYQNNEKKIKETEMKNLYELNSEMRNLSAHQIRTYIHHEIVANTKSSVDEKPKMSENNTNICNVL